MHRMSLIPLVAAALSPVAFADPAPQHDYPTSARVQYVFECMAEHGGADFARMYQCSCSIDQIANALPYDVYEEADTYMRGKHAMGERGGVLREGRRAREMRSLLQKTKAQSEKECFPR